MTTRQGFFCRMLLMAVNLLIIAAMSEKTVGNAAENPQPGYTAAEQIVPVAQPNPFRKYSGNSTADQTHDYIEQNILEHVVRLDDYFGSVRTENMRQARYLLRWRNSLRINNDGKLKPAMTVRANIHLSAINERLRLSIAGDDLPESKSQSLPEDPGNPGLDRTSHPTRLVSTELRYMLLQSATIDSFLGAGIRLTLPLQSFVRARYLYTHQVSDIALVRLGETLFLKNRDGFGATTEVSLERLLDPNTLLRWANSATVSQSISGMEWGSELSLIRELSLLRAATITGGVYGDTTSAAVVTNYRLLANYRCNFLRHWLFYEIEPEVSWPRDASGSYSANFAILLRLDIMFEGWTPASGLK